MLLDRLKLKEAHFLGHSWGGMLAMSFAAHYSSRVKSLILIDSGPFKFDAFINETFSNNIQARLSPADKKTRDSVFRKMRSPSFTKEDKLEYDKWELIPVLFNRTKVDSLILKINKGGNTPKMGSLMFQSLGKRGYDLTERLSRFTKPVHIICGSQDPGAFVSYEIKQVMPKAQIHWINQSGHFPMYEQPGKFYAALNKVLQEL